MRGPVVRVVVDDHVARARPSTLEPTHEAADVGRDRPDVHRRRVRLADLAARRAVKRPPPRSSTCCAAGLIRHPLQRVSHLQADRLTNAPPITPSVTGSIGLDARWLTTAASQSINRIPWRSGCTAAVLPGWHDGRRVLSCSTTAGPAIDVAGPQPAARRRTPCRGARPAPSAWKATAQRSRRARPSGGSRVAGCDLFRRQRRHERRSRRRAGARSAPGLSVKR